MARRRGFGEVERRVSASGKATYRARYATPDGSRYSRTLTTKLDAEAWLAAERSLIDREVWTPPQAQAAQAKRAAAAASNTVAAFAQRYLAERGLRPTTVKGYRSLLATRILPMFGEMPLIEVTLSDIKIWRASLDPKTEARTLPPTDSSAPSSRRPRRRS
jgi:Phage integrase, N-terminal SAM-like domain